ncbi:MAG: hypothetical protein IKL24_04210, partial [Clostridia bacterium]|nr:hypothetical protein [Clostridia bacterium]
TIGFQEVLNIGLIGIKKKILSISKNTVFYESCISSIDSFEIWINRYREALSALEGYEDNFKVLSTVPFLPATSFHEALQSIWSVFAFCRLCGCWPGIGRLDMLLGPYLDRDLKNGIITLSKARELIAHFFIKGCEWITGEGTVSGDAQHYQNIVLGGSDEEGNDVTNVVTYLILDVVEELGISDFPISVRISERTSEQLITRISEVMRYGNGIIAVYNEDAVIEALTNNGYSEAEARGFANDGCWEVMLPGKTYFTYIPFDAVAILQKETLASYNDDTRFDSFEELYLRYICDIEKQVESIFNGRIESLKNKMQVSYAWNESVPCTVISLFVEGCIEKGLSYTDGGPLYTVFSPHLGGLADVANSLYAVKKLVWDEKKISFEGLMTALSQNWEGYEDIRRYALSSFEYFGNDNDEVDGMANRLLGDFGSICRRLESGAAFKFPAGVSTFGRQIDWAKSRWALPCGHKAREILANNFSPTPGTALKGATAVINSYCKIDFNNIPCGTALEVRLLPDDVKGDVGLNALCTLLKAFCSLGGFFMQIDVADSAVLRDAQENPEKYPALAVRIAGWSARFVTLEKEWQDMVIDNMEK